MTKAEWAEYYSSGNLVYPELVEPLSEALDGYDLIYENSCVQMEFPEWTKIEVLAYNPMLSRFILIYQSAGVQMDMEDPVALVANASTYYFSLEEILSETDYEDTSIAALLLWVGKSDIRFLGDTYIKGGYEE